MKYKDKTKKRPAFNQARLRQLVAYSPAINYTCKPYDDYATTFISENTPKQLGYNAREFLDDPKFWSQHIHPEDRQRVFENLKHLFKKGHHLHEYRFLHKDGSYRWMRDEMSLVYDAERNPIEIVGYMADITEYKQTEEALRESEEKYRNLFENAIEGIFQTTPDGRFLSANPAMASMLGYASPEELITSRTDIRSQGYVVPEEREEFKRLIEERSQIRGFEYQTYRKDGSIVWLLENVRLVRDKQGKVLFYEGTAQDITERKRMEEELIKSEKKYRSLVETAGSGIGTIDQKGIFTFVNETLCRMCGYPEKEMIGKHFADFLHPDDRKKVMQVFENAFINPKRNPYIEFRVIHKDGHIVYMCSNPTAFEYGGQLIGFNAIITDITERKRAEAELIEREVFNFALFEYNPIQTIVVDLQGKVIKFNLAKKKSGDRLPNIGDTMYKDYAEKHEIDMYAELMKCIRSREIKEFPEQKYGDKVLSIIISPFPKGAVIICQDITERKRAEETLRYQATLLASTHDAIVASDEHYRLTAWNQAAESIYGWKAEEVLGRFGLDVIQTEFPGTDKSEMLHTIAEIGHWSGEVTQARKDGTRIPVEVASIVLHDESGRITGYLSVNRDISERKQAEEAVRKSEEKYRSLTENVNLGIYRNTVGPEGKFIEANPAIIGMFGYKSKEEFLAINVSDLYQNAADRKKFNDRMLKEGFVRGEELQLRRKDGSLFFGSVSAVAVKDERGHVKYYDGIIDNITERKRAEEALKKSEEYFRALTENSSDIIIILDKKGTITYTSASIERFSGYKPEELIGKSGFDFIKPVDLPRAIYDFGKAILTKETVIHNTFRVRHKDGSERILDGLGKNLFDNPVIAGFVMNTRDITERKREEEEKEKLQAQLIQSEKMAAVGTLANGIAHEFNNILQIIQGHAEFAIKTKKYEDMEDALGVFLQASERASKIIKSLFAFSRSEISKREVHEIPELIESVLLLVGRQLENQNIRIIKDYKGKPRAEVNSAEIQQVFFNIILNAWDAMLPGGGTLEIKVKREKGNVKISFRDSGRGIEEKNLKKIFEPFYTTKGATGGGSLSRTGLGLYVSYGILKEHGATIEVESQPGQGSTFTVKLPVKLTGAKKVSKERRGKEVE